MLLAHPAVRPPGRPIMAVGNDDGFAPPRPAVDEWGIYDPQQAGLEALYSRLETLRRIANTPVDRAFVARAREVLTTPLDGQAIAASMREAARRIVNGRHDV